MKLEGEPYQDIRSSTNSGPSSSSSSSCPEFPGAHDHVCTGTDDVCVGHWDGLKTIRLTRKNPCFIKWLKTVIYCHPVSSKKILKKHYDFQAFRDSMLFGDLTLFQNHSNQRQRKTMNGSACQTVPAWITDCLHWLSLMDQTFIVESSATRTTGNQLSSPQHAGPMIINNNTTCNNCNNCNNTTNQPTNNQQPTNNNHNHNANDNDNNNNKNMNININSVSYPHLPLPTI
jgi:hypothetical protein